MKKLLNIVLLIAMLLANNTFISLAVWTYWLCTGAAKLVKQAADRDHREGWMV